VQERASDDDHVDGGGSFASEKARARIDRRGRRAHVVDEQDAAAVDPSSGAQRKGSTDVPPSIPLLEPDLGRSAPHPHHESGIDRQPKPPCRLTGEEEGLIEAAAPEPFEMKRHGRDEIVIRWVQGEPIREQRGERLGKRTPTRVFQRTQRYPERIPLFAPPVAGDRPEPRECRGPNQTTPTNVARRARQRQAAARADGFFDPPDSSQAAIAQGKICGSLASDARPRKYLVEHPAGDRSQQGLYAMVSTVRVLRSRGGHVLAAYCRARKGATNFRGSRQQMRRFVIGALVGAGLMYFYLYEYASWEGWVSGRFNTVGSRYRGDAHKRQADDALR